MRPSALALARAGYSRRAEILLDELIKQPNLGTALNNVVFPSFRAAIKLVRGNPGTAIEELRPALPYDLGTDAGGTTLYYRGLAYLEMKSWKEATAQFQEILDNRGVVAIDVYWPLVVRSGFHPTWKVFLKDLRLVLNVAAI